MRVIMFPGKAPAHANRYIDILVGALQERGASVAGWHKHFSNQTGDVFHVHWPDVISVIRARQFQRIRGDLIAAEFWRTIERIQRSGGKLVWTVHDLWPHSNYLDDTPFHTTLMNEFMQRVDRVISLTEAGIPIIKEYYPQLVDYPFYVACHPHYRRLLTAMPKDGNFRRSLGIDPNQKVLSFLGPLRPNKEPESLVEAFCELPVERHFLIMAGETDPLMECKLAKRLSGMKNAFCRFSRLSDHDLLKLYSISDAVAVPGNKYFNSGSIYTSLSLDVPVIAMETAVQKEIQSKVGAFWLHLYNGALTGQIIEDAFYSFGEKGQFSCDMSAFDPSLCAAQHLRAYKGQPIL